jgi:hypothetical protein
MECIYGSSVRVTQRVGFFRDYFERHIRKALEMEYLSLSLSL